MSRLISETCAYISPDGAPCYSRPHIGSKFCFQHKLYEKMKRPQSPKKPISPNVEIRVVLPERGNGYSLAWIASFVLFMLILSNEGGSIDGEAGTENCFMMLGILWFWLVAMSWERPKMLDRSNCRCSNCETNFETSVVLKSINHEILGVSESTKAIASSNPVVGVTSAGGHMGVGIGSVRSTSHVPVRIGKLRFSVSCPSCEGVFSWIENREVVQWSDSNGQLSYEIPGLVDLP